VLKGPKQFLFQFRKHCQTFLSSLLISQLRLALSDAFDKEEEGEEREGGERRENEQLERKKERRARENLRESEGPEERKEKE